MRVLLLGAGGMLGHDLVRVAPSHVELQPLTRVELDITDSGALRGIVADRRPAVIINAAGYTAVDRAETERDLAFRLNADAVAQLARVAAAFDSLVVHFSTDYVFDGLASTPYREEAPTNPINVYGESKLAGELGLRESGARWLILRTQWLFGEHGRSFPQTMRRRALERQPTRVVADQIGQLTYTADLAVATWRLLSGGAEGLYHIANSGVVSWFRVAEWIFQDLRCPELVTACTTADYPVLAPRPTYSVLDTSRVQALLGYALPSWDDALVRFSHAVQPLPA